MQTLYKKIYDTCVICKTLSEFQHKIQHKKTIIHRSQHYCDLTFLHNIKVSLSNSTTTSSKTTKANYWNYVSEFVKLNSKSVTVTNFQHTMTALQLINVIDVKQTQITKQTQSQPWVQGNPVEAMTHSVKKLITHWLSATISLILTY